MDSSASGTVRLPYPVGAGLRALAAAIVVAPLLLAPLIPGEREARVGCERTGVGPREGTCTIERVRLVRRERQEVALGFVLRARMTRSVEENAAGVELTTPQGPLVVTTAATPANAERLAREINAFVEDPSRRSIVAVDPSGRGLYAFYVAFTAVLAILAALTYRSAPRVRVELDAEMGVVRVVRRVWPLRETKRSIPRGEIADVLVEGVPEGSPDRFRVAIAKANGDREALTSAYHAGDRAPHEEIAARIRAFTVRGA